MTRTELLMSYIPLADFIARMNGEKCEVLVHDVRDLDHSILYVTQPSLTNRHRGNGMTDYAMELIRSKRYLREPYVVNYVGGSDERTFRSSTYFIRDGDELAGLLCVNIDIGDLLGGLSSLKRALILDPDLLVQDRKETFRLGSTIEERINNIFQRCMEGKTPDQLSTAEKRHIVAELRRDGVFEFKGKVQNVAERLAVSEKTVYRYLKE